MEGLEDYESDAQSGVLGIFHTCELAVRAGEAWADLQFKTRVLDNCKTEDEEDKATDAWSRGVDASGDGYWRYGIASWQGESLDLEVKEVSVMTHFEVVEEEEEEEEEDDDDDDDDGNGNGNGNGDEEAEEETKDGNKDENEAENHEEEDEKNDKGKQ